MNGRLSNKSPLFPLRSLRPFAATPSCGIEDENCVPFFKRTKEARNFFSRDKINICQRGRASFTLRESLQSKDMIELEVYAAGIRNLEKILELDHEFEAVPGLRYKVDSNHDIVDLDFEEPTMTIQEVRSVFRKLGLEPRIVGQVPNELNPKAKTQPIRIA